MDLVELASQVLCQVVIYLLDTALSVAHKIEEFMVEDVGIGQFTLLQGVVNREIKSFECLRSVSATSFLLAFCSAAFDLLLQGASLGQVVVQT